MSAEKYKQLLAMLESFESCIVAYSGGVDSVFLAYAAKEALGVKSLAVIADSPSLPRRELEDAKAIAEQFDLPLRIIHTKEFENNEYVVNPDNRCYFCKQALFTELAPLAESEGFKVIAYGENASDIGDYRPGAQAAKEFQVRAPLKEIGFAKDEIRELSRQFGLPTAEKPQLACLSSRIPHGEVVTTDKLRMIEVAENVLRDLGFYDVRVRHHELRGKETDAVQCLARIEVGESEIQKLFSDGANEKINSSLKRLGYEHVTLNLLAYRRAGMGKSVLESASADE